MYCEPQSRRAGDVARGPDASGIVAPIVAVQDKAAGAHLQHHDDVIVQHHLKPKHPFVEAPGTIQVGHEQHHTVEIELAALHHLNTLPGKGHACRPSPCRTGDK
jgi:hypothetical protein